MDPESTDVVIMELEAKVEVRRTQRKLGSERADTLRWTASIVAQKEIMQSLGCVKARGLLSLFLVPPVPFP